MQSQATATPEVKMPPLALREELAGLLHRYLLGPVGGNEEELDPRDRNPSDRYIVGGLAPGGREQTPQNATTPDSATDTDSEALRDIASSESMATAGVDGPDSQTDSEASLVDSLLPSSAGMSFVVDGAETQLAVATSWARYEKAPSEILEGNPQVWKRIPTVPDVFMLPLAEGRFEEELDSDRHIKLQWHTRKRDGNWYVSLFIVNLQERKERNNGPRWIYQVAMSVTGEEAGRPVFVAREVNMAGRDLLDPDDRDELEDLNLRYRNAVTFGRGHGCAVAAVADANDSHRATQLALDFLPVTIVPGQTPRDEHDDPLLKDIVSDMKELSSMSGQALKENLSKLVNAYRPWADSLGKGLEGKGHDKAVERARKAAHDALRRMEEGIDVLANNPMALKAFHFANQAMYHQRVHSRLTNEVRNLAKPTAQEKAKLLKSLNVPSNRSWRLFQLAFLLLNIPTLTDPLHPERSGNDMAAITDLLWFSTGGGKTEAYLGLTAYTLAIRRLQGNLGDLDATQGVGVLMRYTLRLLTLQQFQRAAALICACELIRQKDTKTWGTEPFRLGLWVGAKSTPNTLQAAADALDSNRNNSGYSSPIQFRTCPWCGAPITDNNVKVRNAVTQSNRCITYCRDPDGVCDFTPTKSPDEGLPVMVVDEEIYRRPPSLLISTVDKFAQMPWKGETEMFFGRVTGRCPRHGFVSPDVEDSAHKKSRGQPATEIEEHGWLRPPDLIIQDELHLISGPLGSMTALYETAVDRLCEWEYNGQTVRPKVVASTATIRRSREQIHRLFNRDVQIFPPPGTDSSDNFFALERATSAKTPGRMYVGVCSIGHRMPPTAVRLYATVMAAAQLLHENYADSSADPWMTTVGYFNSIRELANMRRLVEDEVRGRLVDENQRGLMPRRITRIEELTSRQSGKNIPDILERLENSFTGLNNETPSNKKPYDVVLATNMISVGVDINRLGLMVMHGQPKTTSEYIQATSRVGRSDKAPGIVITIYNWARPRDLSHFEDFFCYHAAFQRQVEALSVTPFASRALERGLAGVLVSLVRLMDVTLNGNDSPKQLDEHIAVFDSACETVLERARTITLSNEITQQIKGMLDSLRDEWRATVARAKDYSLKYKSTKEAKGLLANAGEVGEKFACPNSLRDVESNVDLLLDTDVHNMRITGE